MKLKERFLLNLPRVEEDQSGNDRWWGAKENRSIF